MPSNGQSSQERKRCLSGGADNLRAAAHMHCWKHAHVLYGHFVCFRFSERFVKPGLKSNLSHFALGWPMLTTVGQECNFRNLVHVVNKTTQCVLEYCFVESCVPYECLKLLRNIPGS